MPFHRFEDFERRKLTPHLSSGEAPIIEGRYMYFCMIHKEAGTGSELHYHPNELLIFALNGKINAVVGKDRRIVEPGTFIHVPAYARHSMKATEDGPVDYLYIKDQTWTVVGIAADEAVPEKAMSVDEVNELYDAGSYPGQEKTAQASEIVIDGLPECYYPIIDGLDAPRCSGRREIRVDGERLAFGFCDLPPGCRALDGDAEHEEFTYVLSGCLDTTVGNESKPLRAGDIMEVPRGVHRRVTANGEAPARYVTIRSMPYLEERVDQSA